MNNNFKTTKQLAVILGLCPKTASRWLQEDTSKFYDKANELGYDLKGFIRLTTRKDGISIRWKLKPKTTVVDCIKSYNPDINQPVTIEDDTHTYFCGIVNQIPLCVYDLPAKIISENNSSKLRIKLFSPIVSVKDLNEIAKSAYLQYKYAYEFHKRGI